MAEIANFKLSPAPIFNASVIVLLITPKAIIPTDKAVKINATSDNK